MICAAFLCFVGLAAVAMDLVTWRITGHYQAPSLLSLYAMKWLSLPGIALAGGAAMVAASWDPPRPWAFLISLLMLLMYAWLWDVSHFLIGIPPKVGG
jgi:hypothetical protein